MTKRSDDDTKEKRNVIDEWNVCVGAYTVEVVVYRKTKSYDFTEFGCVCVFHFALCLYASIPFSLILNGLRNCARRYQIR